MSEGSGGGTEPEALLEEPPTSTGGISTSSSRGLFVIGVDFQAQMGKLASSPWLHALQGVLSGALYASTIGRGALGTAPCKAAAAASAEVPAAPEEAWREK